MILLSSLHDALKKKKMAFGFVFLYPGLTLISFLFALYCDYR